MHDKKQILLLNLLINCMAARSTVQILSIKDGCTFLKIFSNNCFVLFFS